MGSCASGENLGNTDGDDAAATRRGAHGGGQSCSQHPRRNATAGCARTHAGARRQRYPASTKDQGREAGVSGRSPAVGHTRCRRGGGHDRRGRQSAERRGPALDSSTRRRGPGGRAPVGVCSDDRERSGGADHLHHDGQLHSGRTGQRSCAGAANGWSAVRCVCRACKGFVPGGARSDRRRQPEFGAARPSR
jgi:hypothetical protein